MKGQTKQRLIVSKYLFKFAEKTVNELEKETPIDIQERAACTVTPAEENAEELYWAFYVTCPSPEGSGKRHLIQFRFEENKNSTDFSDYSAYVTCDCGNFRFGGPGFNANRGDYLFDFAPWAVLAPNMRDPERKHNICKHIFACIEYIKARGLEIEGT